MRINRTHLYAVLTGDIVASSRLQDSDRQRLPRVLRNAGDQVREAYESVIPLPIDLFRGDGWQLVVSQPEMSLTIALAFRSALRVHMNNSKIDSRVSIGIGTLSFIRSDRISEGDGNALRYSGRGLESMDRRVRLKALAAAPTHQTVLDALTWLIDAQACAWTARQAMAITGALQGWTQETISKRWKPTAISQQAVAQHLDRANWFAVEKGISVFKKLVST